MANLNRYFFTNTFITGEGRSNYLRADALEDPLFTSFTFDIDYVTSPLFYTCGDYPYPNTDGLANRIETALKEMRNQFMGKDEGYDILPVLSAGVLDDNKLGFGLQTTVYMDMPLYGATEYIYMVDKIHGSVNQNDVRYDSNRFLETGSNPNTLNSYNVGNTINDVVNESDKANVEQRIKENEDMLSTATDTLNDKDIIKVHKENESNVKSLELDIDMKKRNIVVQIGEELEVMSEDDLQAKIDECLSEINEFDNLKKEIASWVNDNISKYQSDVTSAYKNNSCIVYILGMDDISKCDENVYNNFKNGIESFSVKDGDNIEKNKGLGANFVQQYILGNKESFMVTINDTYKSLVSNTNGKHSSIEKKDDGISFLLDEKDNSADVRLKYVIDKFKDRLIKYGFLDESGNYVGDWKVQVVQLKDEPEWVAKSQNGFVDFVKKLISIAQKKDGYKKLKNGDSICKDYSDMIKSLMTYMCDVDETFVNFESDKNLEISDKLMYYESIMSGHKGDLYGYRDGEPCDETNYDPTSLYGKLKEAKNIRDNDDYTQAKNIKESLDIDQSVLKSDLEIMEHNQNIVEEQHKEAIETSVQPIVLPTNKSIVPAQTLLDMLGFISGMKKLTMDYPYIIQGITGLDTAYNNHYVIKDPYLGSGDNKITITCYESLDLRVSSMFNRYFNAVYDRQYRRERVPVNLRRFNCSVYVHDPRHFVVKSREKSYNRILELTDMYYSVIEFRFYDCEIVPEETGNIFNDISNEAPSEMKKTNFTFTYGNCVVNFVPYSEVAAHKGEKKEKKRLKKVKREKKTKVKVE